MNVLAGAKTIQVSDPKITVGCVVFIVMQIGKFFHVNSMMKVKSSCVHIYMYINTTVLLIL